MKAKRISECVKSIRAHANDPEDPIWSGLERAKLIYPDGIVWFLERDEELPFILSSSRRRIEVVARQQLELYRARRAVDEHVIDWLEHGPERWYIDDDGRWTFHLYDNDNNTLDWAGWLVYRTVVLGEDVLLPTSTE